MNNHLSTLAVVVKRRKKRLGRGAGSGKGAKSGRGTTRHQRARENVPLDFEGGQGRMIKRFPLLRGKGKNKSIQLKPIIIGLGELNIYKEGETVSAETLIAKGLLAEEFKKDTIKILANGKIHKKLTIALPVSQSVRKLVESAGGQVKGV